MLITKHFTFEASHILPKHKGKCSRLHGHSWKLAVTIEGAINEETGFVVDYSELKKLVDTHVIEPLDHTHLGAGVAACGVPDAFLGDVFLTPYFGVTFYPSSENLCRAIFKLLKPLIGELETDVRLFEVKIAETCTSEAAWGIGDDE